MFGWILVTLFLIIGILIVSRIIDWFVEHHRNKPFQELQDEREIEFREQVEEEAERTRWNRFDPGIGKLEDKDELDRKVAERNGNEIE